MRKGRFGIVLCLYPILAFAGVILNQPIICALIFGFTLLAERDEWAGRQTLQALILSAVTAVIRKVLMYVAGLFPAYSGIGLFEFFSIALNVISAIIYLLAIVVSVLAIIRVMKDQEADLPVLSGLAYRAYGKRKPQPMPGQYPPPPFQQPVPPTYQQGQTYQYKAPVPPQSPVPPTSPVPPVPPTSATPPVPPTPPQPGTQPNNQPGGPQK